MALDKLLQLVTNALDTLVVEASALIVKGPQFKSWLSHTNDLKIDILVNDKPETWLYRISAMTGSVSVDCDWVRQQV